MLSVAGEVKVRCTIEEAWDLFSRFGDVAELIPTVEDVEVDGEHIHARVSTKLGALPITSRVTLRVTGSKPDEWIEAEGLSYLGETIKEQIKKNVDGVAKDSAGRLFLRLDLCPGDEEGRIVVAYSAEVEAKGRLKRIYKAILKTKVPAMMEEFAQNLRQELEREEAAAPCEEAAEPAEPAAEALGQQPGELSEPAAEPAVEAAPGSALALPRPGLFARLLAWLGRLFRQLRGST